jgi:putative transposase
MDVRSLVVTWSEDAPRGAVARFVEEHGVSRAWFYEVRNRARSEGALAAMQPRSRSSGVRHPQAIPVEVEELAVRIRKELADAGWDHGPLSVRHRLQELGVTAPAASTLARVFTRHGMVVPQPHKRPRSSYRRFEFDRVHECWQLDALEWALADGSRCAIFQLLDDHSRYLIASHVAPGERSVDAITVVRSGIERFQVPCLLLSDNGVAFNRDRLGHQTQLVALLTSLGCRPITGRPGHPQTQGKDERVHQTEPPWIRRRAGWLGDLRVGGRLRSLPV